MRKNRALALQIRELAAQQKFRDTELLNKTSFVQEKNISLPDDDLCPESRKDKFCIAIRDLLLREKAYRNPLFTRDYLIERLGTNRELFVDAFYFCFGMSFSEYINDLRMRDAIVLLEQSDLSIESISPKRVLVLSALSSDNFKRSIISRQKTIAVQQKQIPEILYSSEKTQYFVINQWKKRRIYASVFKKNFIFFHGE
jgi:AraC-like DNA-binding protein